jgi:peptide/nickel transport system substrate-binding protein
MSWLRLLVLVPLAGSSLLAISPDAWAASAGTVVIAQGIDPTTLDPMNHSEAAATVLANNLFDGLLERDADLNLVPLLAESYQSVNQTTWEFKLRRGIRFQNGEPFDAESVKFSLERLIDPKLKLRGASAFTPLSHVEIVDPFTVRVHSKAGWPLLPTVLTIGQAAMLPPKYYRDKDMPYLQKNPVSSGPFKLVRWDKGRPNRARKERAVLARGLEDQAARLQAHPRRCRPRGRTPERRRGCCCEYPTAPGRHHRPSSKLFLSTAPSTRTIQLLYYTHQYDSQHKLVGPYAGPTADRRVRLAMNYALDVDQIIRMVLDGQGVRLALLLTPKHLGFEPALKPIAQDLARTKKLLTEAGFPNGMDIVLNSSQGRFLRDREVAEAVAGQLTKAGIRTTLRMHEGVTWLNNVLYVHKAGPAPPKRSRRRC